MAVTIPETLGPGVGTSGEQKVLAALREHLPDSYVVYYHGETQGRRPAFVIIGPELGVVALESRDWPLDAIARVTGSGISLRASGREQKVGNPLRKAHDYISAEIASLKKRFVLADGGALRCATAYGVAFPSMTRREVEGPSAFGPSLEETLGRGLVVTDDDLGARTLLARLQAMDRVPVSGREPLNQLQIDEIRGVLFPETRIGSERRDEGVFRVMSPALERVARAPDGGHRLLRGVSGSGKTVALLCRGRHLRERHPDWRILLLCFNRILAAHLRAALGADARLEVAHFHRWCWQQLEASGATIPEPPGPGEPSDYWETKLPALLRLAYERRRLARGAYQAILIDEGHDFLESWYRAIVPALDPKTGSLFIAIDSSQRLHGRRMPWEAMGIGFGDNVHRLTTQDRNTRPILAAAHLMIRDLDAARGEHLTPEDTLLRDGPLPEVTRYDNAEAQRRAALAWIRDRLARHAAPDDVMVLGLVRPEMARIETWLEDAGVPAHLSSAAGDPPGMVRVSTIHGAKGLEAEHVLVMDAHKLGRLDDEHARRLLYIAMTRARTDLAVMSVGSTPVLSQLASLVARPA
jgi:hypothetical protein